MVPVLDSLPDFFLFLCEGWLLGGRGFDLIGIAGIGNFGGVGFGVIARPFVFFFDLGLEEIESLIHAMVVRLIVITIISVPIEDIKELILEEDKFLEHID